MRVTTTGNREKKDPHTGVTQKQEAFCQLIAQAWGSRDAYREAYGAKNCTDKTVSEAASRLLRQSNVEARIKALRGTTIRDFIWTREMSIKTLTDVIKNTDRYSEKILAVKELNVMHGFNEAVKVNIGGQPNNPILIAAEEAGL